MMSTRFEAEAIIRAATSGAFPKPGDVLLRAQDGWVFGQAVLGASSIPPSAISSLPFYKITGVASRAQLPVTIAYEDEINTFLLDQFFLGIVTEQNQVRRGIRTISGVDSPYTWQTDDWHLNVDTSVTEVKVRVPDAAAHYNAGFTDQLHFKNIGTRLNQLNLVPVVPGQLIDGYTDAIIRKSMRSFTLVSDGNDWWIQ